MATLLTPSSTRPPAPSLRKTHNLADGIDRDRKPEGNGESPLFLHASPLQFKHHLWYPDLKYNQWLDRGLKIWPKRWARRLLEPEQQTLQSNEECPSTERKFSWKRIFNEFVYELNYFWDRFKIFKLSCGASSHPLCFDSLFFATWHIKQCQSFWFWKAPSLGFELSLWFGSKQ